MTDYIKYIKKILELGNLGIKFYLIIFFSLISTLFDILSIILIIPIAAIIFDASSSGILSDLLKSLENFQIFNDKKNFLIVFLIIFIIKTFLTIFIYRYISRIRLELKAKLRIDLINKYNLTEYSSFRQKLSSHHI